MFQTQKLGWSSETYQKKKKYDQPTTHLTYLEISVNIIGLKDPIFDPIIGCFRNNVIKTVKVTNID